MDDVVGIFVSCILEELGRCEKAAGGNLKTGAYGPISTEKVFKAVKRYAVILACLRVSGPGLEAWAGQSLGHSIRSELILASLGNQVVGGKETKNTA